MSGERRQGGNTGYYMVRNQPATRSLFNRSISYAEAHAELDDQASFWRFIRSNSPDIVFGPLPIARFMPGNEACTQETVVYHLNWILGMQAKLRKHDQAMMSSIKCPPPPTLEGESPSLCSLLMSVLRGHKPLACSASAG